MAGLVKYLVWDWLLNDQKGVRQRAKVSGGVLVEVLKAADVEARDKVIITFLKEFIEWNACVAENDEKGIYKCDQCDNRYENGGCEHDEGCLVTEAQRLLARLEEGVR